MPEEIATALSRVAATLPPVDWPEPDEIRRLGQARRRRRSVLAAFAAVLLVAGGAGVFHTITLPSKASATNNGPSGTASACPGGLVPAKLALPDFRDIKVNVYNGTPQEGLAEQVGSNLRVRGLAVRYVGNAYVGYDGTALIRFGPDAVGAAWVMRSFFADQAATEFDISRRTDTVDITLGSNFQSLATTTEVNTSIANLGRAVAPPGTCGVG